ncbi:hypothetical protein C0992_008634 [Termitomyces sp. T32_za158]|nr:hypothetical protein C0992_008634 [Termitomyces sp. T32_za158]
MLEFAWEYKKAIDELTKNAANKLRDFELTSTEWDMVRELATTLKPLKDATLLFSTGSPNLPYVIPVMDRIDTLFTEALRDTATGTVMRTAIQSAKKTLNKYYSHTDDVEIY